MNRAAIVIDLQYGDSGKGLMTDYLVRRIDNHNGKKTIVVRFSGGQQAGHTVVTDKHKHIFANYGSGSLAGASSYFSEHCTFYPPNILRERLALEQKDANVDLTIHPLCNLTTPYDIAYNRLLENARGNDKHGSCGLGVGETIGRNTESPYKLYAVDLLYPELLPIKLANIKEYYLKKMVSSKFTYIHFGYNDLDKLADESLEQFIEQCKAVIISDVVKIKGYEALFGSNLVFEGSQGIMLDMDHGQFPHVTRTNTTSKNAISILAKIQPIDRLDTYYVIRPYQTRHGNGWMNKEDPALRFPDDTNSPNKWQGTMRFGDFDINLIKYALNVDTAYNSISDTSNLVITHMDQHPSKLLASISKDLKLDQFYFSYGPKASDIKLITTTLTSIDYGYK
jgi:adenylosuccinate synthase